MKHRKSWFALLGLLALAAMPAAQAQSAEETSLLDALRAGGKVIVMRHANSPRQEPDAASANPDNPSRERQLDAEGVQATQAMGETLRELRIPVDSILSSPTYRARQTAELLGFGAAEPREELGNEGMAAAGEQNVAWLREQVRQAPAAGNRLLITHGPNLSAAFPEHSQGMGEGEALVFDPGQEAPLGRLTMQAWAELE